ncbi:hypothetical protein [Gynurincola endophyticus]|uniref:hypothetical protein n=1 Tax=Gynurincola endophyticus TaxID=2479004 RepID=UPI000F8D5B8A|nr:hypothetical protein [Gynurincola endophyticus]
MYWSTVLDHFEREHYFVNGLTIPFIIGSRTILEPDEPIQSINELFADILKSDCYVQVLKCDWIGEYVFRLSNKATQDIYGGFDNIVVIDDSFPNATCSADVITTLENRYTKFIEAEKYSWIDGDWQKFSNEIDLPRLNEIN